MSSIMSEGMSKVAIWASAVISYISDPAHDHGHSHSHSHSHSHGNSHGNGHAHGHSHTGSIESLNSTVIVSITQFLKNNVFVFDSRNNALISSAIIHILPFLIICTLPISLDMKLLVSFAMGTLLGEVFLHLIPESNTEYLGWGLFIGMLTFLSIDKLMRICIGSSGHDHGHSHGHSHSHTSDEKPKEDKNEKSNEKSTSIYLNIITLLLHNITDGITIATSFYKSVPIGTLTMVAFIFHEFPHQLSDYVFLTSVSNKNSNKRLNFLKKNVIWSLMGSMIGVMVYSAINGGLFIASESEFDIFGKIDNYLLPFSAGGLLYMCAVNVLPEVLESDDEKNTGKFQELFQWIKQVIAICIGFYLMYIMAE